MKKGDVFKLSYLISDSLYQSFVNTFNDRNPLHISDLYAQEKGFKTRVMHGNILGGFLSHFIGEGLPIKNVVLQSQEIKYMKPVYENTRLTLIAEIEDIYESVNTIEFKYHFLNEENNKIAKGKIQIGILT